MSSTIYINNYELFFNDTLTVIAEEAEASNSVLLIVGTKGYDSIEQVIKRGHRAVFSFDHDYEIRVLNTSSTVATIDVHKIETIHSKYAEFIDHSLGSIPDSEDKFTAQEIIELKEKLSALQQEFSEHCKESREEAAYAKASFELLKKMLDESSKTSWRQTAYSIVTSIGLSVTPEHINNIISTSQAAIEFIAK